MRHLLNRTLTHLRATETVDEYGQPQYTWQVLGTFPGRIRTASVQERTAAGLQQVVHVDYVVYAPPEVDLRRGDRVQDGDVTVEIVFVRVPSVPGHHLEAEGKWVEG